MLRLQADLRWLEACERNWTVRKERAMSDTEGTSVLRARGLRKDYGRGEPDWSARSTRSTWTSLPGETVAVMGPSGCGKSTLLHLLGGLDRPTAGELWLDGRRIDQLSEKALARLRRDAIGFVFQAFHLMDELTAAGERRAARAAGRALAAGRPSARR